MNPFAKLPPELKHALRAPARALKRDLVTLVRFMEARIAADTAALAAKDYALREAAQRFEKLERQFAQMQARYAEVVDTSRHVQDKAQLLTQLRDLTAQGVPCFMQGGVIKHRYTKAVLAQVQP